MAVQCTRRHGGIDYGAECGGSLFCAECHVIVARLDWARVGDRSNRRRCS